MKVRGSSVALAVSCILIILSNDQSNCVPIEEFFQFGSDATDDYFSSGGPPAPVAVGDDDTVELADLAVNFLYFNKTYTTIIIYINGIITFGPSTLSFTPIEFPQETGIPAVAPFWADVDIRGTGSIWYRLTDETDTAAVNKVKNIVADAFKDLSNFVATQLLIVTWDRVGYYERKTDKTNTFQCVVASDGSTTIVIFLYADDGINWTTGDANTLTDDGLGGTPAQAGFDAGDGVNFKVIEGSFTDDVINIEEKSNVENAGLFVFQVNQAEIQAPVPTCPVVGSDACKERLFQLACTHIKNNNRNDAVITPCQEILNNN